MTHLVLQAHPLDDSYNAALLNAVVTGSAHGDDVRVVRASEGDELTADVVAGARTFTAVYPTWWGSVPAAMLDQLNRLIGPWVDGSRRVGTSPLRSVTRLEAVTSHGSSLFINRLQGEQGKQLWKRTVLPLCAPKAEFEWKALYGMDRIADTDRRAFLDSI